MGPGGVVCARSKIIKQDSKKLDLVGPEWESCLVRQGPLGTWHEVCFWAIHGEKKVGKDKVESCGGNNFETNVNPKSNHDDDVTKLFFLSFFPTMDAKLGMSFYPTPR